VKSIGMIFIPAITSVTYLGDAVRIEGFACIVGDEDAAVYVRSVYKPREESAALNCK